MSKIFFKILSVVRTAVLVINWSVISMLVVFVVLGMSLLREGSHLESQTFFLASLAWFFMLTPIALGEDVMKMGLIAKFRDLVSKK